jgi:hypothetical protein
MTKPKKPKKPKSPILEPSQEDWKKQQDLKPNGQPEKAEPPSPQQA